MFFALVFLTNPCFPKFQQFIILLHNPLSLFVITEINKSAQNFYENGQNALFTGMRTYVLFVDNDKKKT
ncbi:hypothetical protein BIV59_07935 [Bacillus sp. MUM 13]|nr:hypothetical protein BIV59_07935 [Bacillus sp. MUM 13]